MKTHVLETYKNADETLRAFIVQNMNGAYSTGFAGAVRFSFNGDGLVYERNRKYATQDEWAMLRYIMGLITGYSASLAVANALAVMVLNHSIREWLEVHDPKAFEQAAHALTTYDPAYGAKLDEARTIAAANDPRNQLCVACGHSREDHDSDGSKDGACWNGSGYGNQCTCTRYAKPGDADPNDHEGEELNWLDDDEPPACPVCDGPGVPLGSLGSRAHFRCRNCGIPFSHDTTQHA